MPSSMLSSSNMWKYSAYMLWSCVTSGSCLTCTERYSAGHARSACSVHFLSDSGQVTGSASARQMQPKTQENMQVMRYGRPWLGPTFPNLTCYLTKIDKKVDAARRTRVPCRVALCAS